MKKNAIVNIVASIIAQVITILCGLIVPRLLLSTFGSEANGLVASLTQFLNYIALVEGGLGSVVLTALYGPLAKKDNKEMSKVLSATNHFFKQIAIIFVIYVVVLSLTYPFIVKTSFSRLYIASLTVILAISLFIQYFFSITYKLLLQADQRMYIVQIVQIVSTITNLIVVYITIKVWPNLHVVKLLSTLLFVAQPIVFSNYVNKHYTIDRNIKFNKEDLPDRWSCFGQNLAYFIHENTDTVVLSLFTNLRLVSVYSVYFLVVNHLKSFFKSFSHAFAPMIGKAIAIDDQKNAIKYFDIYEYIVSSVATIVYGATIYLLPSFVMIYTKGIRDADYYQPIFSTIIVLAEMVYSIRDPYVSVVYAAGKFKETALSAYLEAVINIILSVALVKKFGLIGIAVGTLVGMLYRMIYLIYYIRKYLLVRPVFRTFKRCIISACTIYLSFLIMKVVGDTGLSSIIIWVKNGILSVCIYMLVLLLLNLVFDRKTTLSMIEMLKMKR